MTLFQKGVLKIHSKSGYDCIKFNTTIEEYEQMKNHTIDLVGTCALNQYNGEITPQIKIIDWDIGVSPWTWEYDF